MNFIVDVDENKWSKKILEILLLDRTANRNIIWGTEDYENLGAGYNSHFPIESKLITGERNNVIKPRILKSKESQGVRTKDKAEVFTPSLVCNAQNNLIDNDWFGRESVFNIEKEASWKTNIEKVEFPNVKNKTWKDYVDERRIEITCGEAPYLVSRYDTVTGEIIEVKDRIGLLDRKLRVVGENTSTQEEWLEWTERAFQSIYGFEFQGDSLLLARENLLATYVDYFYDKFQREPSENELEKIAKIISWNLWQMDGLTYTIPFQERVDPLEQLDFFGQHEKDEKVLCKIKDWRANKIITFQSLVN